MRKPRDTTNLTQQHTAWFQLASAAGLFMDRFQGEVNDRNRADLQALYQSITRVMALEGIPLDPSLNDYELEFGAPEE